LKELCALLATPESGNSTFRISTYNLLSRLFNDFGAGLHSARETKLLDSLVKSALDDIATLNSISTIPSLSVFSL
jgi:hypothetical protein